MSVPSATQIVQESAQKNDWCLCIFFSVDIEGATAYKVETRARTRDDEWRSTDDDWCFLFESFYVDFPECFLSEYSVLANTQATKTIQEPTHPALWKFIGDEILFYAPLSDSCQTLEHIRAFHQAIVNYNAKLRVQGVKVRCKGTVWLVGFPNNNRIVLIPPGDTVCQTASNSLIDFVGSSTDCGFRLTKYSSSRMLVVSLDLLWMLMESIKRYETATCFEFIRRRIRYAGKHELKGIFSGKPYPVFWIDSLAKPPVEDKWTNMAVCECDDIIRFCEEFSESANPNDFIRPFVFGDPSGLFIDIPHSFELRRDMFIRYKTKATKQTAEAQPETHIHHEGDTEQLLDGMPKITSHVRSLG